MPAEVQTKCVITKLADGTFDFKQFTFIPSLEFMNGKTQNFSGAINIEHWNGSAIKNYLLGEGKVYDLNSCKKDLSFRATIFRVMLHAII